MTTHRPVTAEIECHCTRCCYARKHPQFGPAPHSQAPRPVTGPDGDNPIRDEQIRELKHNTGWLGEGREAEHRIIGNALRGDKVARGLCAGFWNERTRCAAAYNARYGVG